ncbi:hypothetical protein [Shewanella sp. MBTL60-007]|uniref:hypothetical protein n=1 Tax=Shewanella sp. MBTL60-007 TaxID=2815911 RepID=UPI001BBEE3EF|nr:hypothetical protein [Shewanella sp. MBTL60-007]GIU31274.1 hypothetical protein TUM3792_42860 [Shewanella sp. MBTL60-007]
MSTEKEDHQQQSSDDIFNSAALDALDKGEDFVTAKPQTDTERASKEDTTKTNTPKTRRSLNLPVKKIFLATAITALIGGNLTGLGYLYLELTSLQKSIANGSKERLQSNLEMLNTVNENSTLSEENKLGLNALSNRLNDFQNQSRVHSAELAKINNKQAELDSKQINSSGEYINQSALVNELQSDFKQFKSSVQRQLRAARTTANEAQPPAKKPTIELSENVYSIDGLELVSIDLYAKYRVAVFTDNKGELLKRMIGEKIGKWRITNIERNKSLVELTNKDKLVYLKLVEG